MPISDEEAYRQGKLIAQDMLRGTYSPGKDYSTRPQQQGTTTEALLGLAVLVGLVVGAIVLWKFVF